MVVIWEDGELKKKQRSECATYGRIQRLETAVDEAPMAVGVSATLSFGSRDRSAVRLAWRRQSLQREGVVDGSKICWSHD